MSVESLEPTGQVVRLGRRDVEEGVLSVLSALALRAEPAGRAAAAASVGDVQTSVRAFKAGAFDFLQKPAPPSVLLERIHAAIDFDHQARAVKTDRATVSERLTQLTAREHEVMELVIAGKRSQEIAAALHVSVRTVEGHRRRVLSKAKVSSAAQLVRTVLNARETGPRT